MKNLVRLEEFMFFILSIFMFSKLDYAWWWMPILFLVPDLGMLGYVFGTETGAFVYNVVHHRGLSIALYILGSLLANQLILLIAVILFSHSSLDRVFDYGLKYGDDFKHTHLS